MGARGGLHGSNSSCTSKNIFESDLCINFLQKLLVENVTSSKFFSDKEI